MFGVSDTPPNQQLANMCTGVISGIGMSSIIIGSISYAAYHTDLARVAIVVGALVVVLSIVSYIIWHSAFVDKNKNNETPA